jgi:hypothetical protein
MKSRSLILFLFALAASTVHLRAQTSLGTSAVGDTVKDPSGLGVPAASVKLADVQHGVSGKR